MGPIQPRWELSDGVLLVMTAVAHAIIVQHLLVSRVLVFAFPSEYQRDNRAKNREDHETPR